MSISDLLKFGGKRSDQPAPSGSAGDSPASKAPEQIIQSKALPKFISALSNHQSPLLIDFGPVIGTNVAFFGEQLSCKLFIEDLAAEIDKLTRAKSRDTLPAMLAKRFTQAEASVVGVLCWHILDFLEPPAAKALAREIVRVLRPGGAVMAFFCSTSKPMERHSFSKYEIVAANSSLRQRHHSGTGGPKYVMQNRDILRMFEGLTVAESFLLKSNTREILLRKRA